MHIKSSYILFPFFTLVLLVGNVFAQESYKSQLDRLVKELSETTTGGTILIAKDGNVIYRKAFGKADLELDVAMEPHHIHRIGSITKQFTAVAILRLQEEGKLLLQDDIRKYIEDYPARGHTITIEHLLTHTSGIANYTAMPQFKGSILRKDLTPLELIDFFKDEPMDFAPGEEFRYNNSGYILLGHIIETVAGTTYAEYLQKNFFEPLGMTDTRYDSTSEIIANRVSGYSWRNGSYHNAPFLSMTLPYAGGSLISTVDDLFRWNSAIIGHSVLNEESTAMAHSVFLLNDGNPTGYGYGWRLGRIQESPTVKHGGTVNGFSSYALYVPKENIYAVALTNCDCTWNIENIVSRMAAIVMDKPYSFKETEISQRRLRDVQGVYRSSNGEERTIRYEDGSLLFFPKGGEKTRLAPLDRKRFRLGKSLNVLELKENTKGFIIKSLDSPTEWKKTKKKINALESIQLSPMEKEQYVGEYRLSQNRTFKIITKEGRIFGQMGTNQEEILPLDKEHFYAKGIDAELVFDLEKDGSVIGLTLIQGKTRNAVKIK